jgi:hypothetical protein
VGKLVTLGGDVALWQVLHGADEQKQRRAGASKWRRWWSWLRK